MSLENTKPVAEMSGTEMETPSYRTHCSMVIFALEQALGAFVVQFASQPSDLPEAGLTVIEKRGKISGFAPVSQIVQGTYLKEIIDFATTASKDISEKDELVRLRKLVEVLDVFGVRNAVCHPNRPFPEFYWYRMAALATDPCIEKLRLRKVTDAFRCVVENQLTPPPDGWLQQPSWSVPNNLPSTFDHQVTGLIARQDDSRELKKRLKNMRNSLIAIVGPGGTGKTALCLDVLRDCVLDPDTLEWADQIIYVTAKTERLTIRGVETITEALTTLDTVKHYISQALYGLEQTADETETLDFEKASKEFGDRRVLLCIDNLETIIGKHPLDFEDFAQSLPRNWRILVTSRVTINGANVLTLSPIALGGATKLARDYSSLRASGRLAELQLSQLVEKCDRNPLAIRLVIDSFAAGSELSTSLEQTRDRIIDFSYTSLIEHMPANSTKALECLFGSSGSLSRGQIGHLLELTQDEVAEAVNSLLKTSLITRTATSTSEGYALSSSVRDLLLRTPRDKNVREYVYNRLREQQRIIEELDKRGTRDTLDATFVPPTSASHIRALVARHRFSVMGRGTRAEQLSALNEIKRLEEFDSNDPVLHRTAGILLENLGDRYGALECFERAITCTVPDPCSQLRVAEILKDEETFKEAIERAKPLIDAGLLSNPDIHLRNRTRLLKAYWLSTLWLGRYDEVISETEKWRDAGELRPAYAALRVSAIKAAIDDSLDMANFSHYIPAMLSCLGDEFRLDGYLSPVVHEGFRALERLQNALTWNMLTSETILVCARFIDEHLADMCSTSNEHSISDEFICKLIEKFRGSSVPGSNNPLEADRWSEIIHREEPEDEDALEAAGYERARITRLVFEHNHIFARSDDNSRDFFIRMSATDLKSSDFCRLKLGQSLMVLPSSDPPIGGRAWPAKHAMIV